MMKFSGFVPKHFHLSKFIFNRDQNDENKYICGWCLSPSYNIPNSCVKLDYISSLTSQTACLGKICEPRDLGPKLTKSAIFFFCIFFCQINWRGDHRTLYFFKLNSDWKFFGARISINKPNSSNCIVWQHKCRKTSM